MNPVDHSPAKKPYTKLSFEKATEIRRRFASGESFVREMGREFGVSESAIKAVLDGRTWKRPRQEGKCPHGHEFTDENTYINKRGIRECRACRHRSREAYRFDGTGRFKASLKAYKRRRKARMRGVDATLTAQEWRDIQKRYDYRCFYCDMRARPLEQEHKQPLSRGGGHTKENVVPACRACNLSKKTKTFSEFLHATWGYVPYVGATIIDPAFAERYHAGQRDKVAVSDGSLFATQEYVA